MHQKTYLTLSRASGSWKQTSHFRPQNPLPRQRSCQHVSGSVRIGWCLLPHGHPLLGHGWRGSSCQRSWRSHHGHFRWVTETMCLLKQHWTLKGCWVTGWNEKWKDCCRSLLYRTKQQEWAAVLQVQTQQKLLFMNNLWSLVLVIGFYPSCCL